MPRDGQAIDLRPVLAAEVLQQVGAYFALGDASVVARHLRIIQGDYRVPSPPDDRLVPNLEFATRLRAGNGDQPCRPGIEHAILSRNFARTIRQSNPDAEVGVCAKVLDVWINSASDTTTLARSDTIPRRSAKTTTEKVAFQP